MRTVEIVDYGPFEIEVGSPAHVRLTEQDKLPQFTETREIQVEGAAEQVEEPDEGVVNLSKLTRTELDQAAAEAGVENPESLGSKGDVIAAIEAAQAAGETLTA